MTNKSFWYTIVLTRGAERGISAFMKNKLFKEVITIPNLITLLRFIFLGVFMVLYLNADTQAESFIAIAFLALGFLTDFFDGFIARRFNMVSDFGKALDPIADKLSQGVIMLCLISKHKLMLLLVGILVFKEGFMAVMGIKNFRRGVVNSAKWYGKICTTVLFIALLILLLFPSINTVAANVIIVICAAVMIWSTVMYARFFYLESKGKK